MLDNTRLLQVAVMLPRLERASVPAAEHQSSRHSPEEGYTAAALCKLPYCIEVC